MRMITHSYDNYDEAVRVVNALEAAGVPHEDVSLVSGDKDRTVATTVIDHNRTATGAGTGATIGTVLGGGAGLLAGIGSLAIPGVGPIVAAGWLIAAITGAGVGAAAGGLVGSLTGAGVSEADAHTYAEHVGRGGTLVTVRSTDEMATQVETILEYGAETPVTEQVTLQEERVIVERRPVNHALSAMAADAFRARTLPARATSEEAVVAKDAQTIEEVGLNKQATDRVQTVRGTKVDVEQIPGTVSSTGYTSVSGGAGTTKI